MPGPLHLRRTMSRTTVCWALAIVVSLSSCASPFVDPPAESEDVVLPKDLGRSASAARDRSSSKAEDSGTEGTAESKGGVGARTPSSGEDGEGDAKQGSSPQPVGEGFTAIGSFEDASGDAADPAPDHADVVGVAIADDGARAQVVVEVAGRLPARTADAEVVGLGVDLYRKTGDYQLFASGEPSGWYGYLYTPDGFVAYRGDLQLGARTLTFTVPWDAIGGRGAGEFGMFLDWTGPGDRYSQDMAPDSGRVPFSPPS